MTQNRLWNNNIQNTLHLLRGTAAAAAVVSNPPCRQPVASLASRRGTDLVQLAACPSVIVVSKDSAPAHFLVAIPAHAAKVLARSLDVRLEDRRD